MNSLLTPTHTSRLARSTFRNYVCARCIATSIGSLRPRSHVAVEVPKSRRLSSSAPRLAQAQRARSENALLVSAPTTHDLENLEIDPEVLLPTREATLNMTDRCAEQLRSISKREANREVALRVVVESGGCHGYQYKMSLARKREPDDYHFTHSLPSTYPANIYIDAVSFSLLNGSTIDFATELIGSSFRIVDNPHSKGAGCGCGVSWELKT